LQIDGKKQNRDDNVKKTYFLYKLNRYIYNYHNQSNYVPVIRVYY